MIALYLTPGASSLKAASTRSPGRSLRPATAALTAGERCVMRRRIPSSARSFLSASPAAKPERSAASDSFTFDNTDLGRSSLSATAFCTRKSPEFMILVRYLSIGKSGLPTSAAFML